jgi:hypothetical protein
VFGVVEEKVVEDGNGRMAMTAVVAVEDMREEAEEEVGDEVNDGAVMSDSLGLVGAMLEEEK